jgi:3-oxoacyl-[acyl-carrier protein] reductase
MDDSNAGAGRTAVITGGARGFGKAFAEALGTRGYHVALIDRDEAALAATTGRLTANGISAAGHPADVTHEAGVMAAMAEAAQVRGGIDLLINNAGLHSVEYNRSLTDMGYAKARRLFEVNVLGIIACTLAAHPHMAGRPGANVVNIASSAAWHGNTAYGTSKIAAAHLAIVLGSELAAAGIRVNAIAPGMILTDTIRAELPQALKDTVRSLQFLKQDGEERDIVEAMLFLSSEKARFITGETLRVTGGMAAGV